MLNIKIDTKEKFTVLYPQNTSLAANMADEIIAEIQDYQTKVPAHIILNLQLVNEIDAALSEKIALLQQDFYEKNFSFVICCINESLLQTWDKLEILEVMNITPTESEAWDIVQMEEIERELLGGE